MPEQVHVCICRQVLDVVPGTKAGLVQFGCDGEAPPGAKDLEGVRARPVSRSFARVPWKCLPNARHAVSPTAPHHRAPQCAELGVVSGESQFGGGISGRYGE